MKIGVLTYHSSHNYGAFLQSYALVSYLRETTGNDIELIDFEMQKSHKMNETIIKQGVRSLRSFIYNKRRYKMFNISLSKNKNLSKDSLISDDLNEFSNFVNTQNYDIVIVGSDEVWKLDGYRGFPNPYWLPDICASQKFAYATSSRTEFSNVSDEALETIKEYLNSFSYIGVRDNVTKNLIETLTDKTVHLNCDPTFLYDFHSSKDVGKYILRKKFKIRNNKKCIALMCGVPELAKEIISRYKKEFNFICLYNYYPGSKGFYVPDPWEWMDIIAGCDGLITTFFHGMVFAIKNNTPFIAIENRKVGSNEWSKSYDLLKRNGLQDMFYLYDGNAKSFAMGPVGYFLSKVFAGSMDNNYSSVCENEKKLAESFIQRIPDNTSKHIVINSEYDCCGCGACEFSCPKNAINMVTDSKGFRYPKINSDLCVNCGVCKTVCTFNDSWGNIKKLCNANPVRTYGVKHKSNDVIAASRSGGAFTALSDYVLHKNGIIYGAGYNDELVVIHKRATNSRERDELRNSKYVQSNIEGIYRLIKQDLLSGKLVLFSGTPCQTAAVRKVMSNFNTTNLILLDIVCHGVPSPLVYKDYLLYLENKYNGKIESFVFRNKVKFGWRSHVETFVINGKEYSKVFFSHLFYAHKILRKSCFNCKYKCITRVSDITLADFWGIEKNFKEFDDNKGVSLVFANTEKGYNLVSQLKDIISVEVDYKNCLQNSLKHNYPLPNNYDAFWEEYKNKGISNAIKKNEKDIKKQGPSLYSKILRKLGLAAKHIWYKIK